MKKVRLTGAQDWEESDWWQLKLMTDTGDWTPGWIDNSPLMANVVADWYMPQKSNKSIQKKQNKTLLRDSLKEELKH